MGRAYDFVQVDVFTERLFGGNPLAVFLDGRGLDDAHMQALAREMNLSETTFVLPATRAGGAGGRSGAPFLRLDGPRQCRVRADSGRPGRRRCRAGTRPHRTARER